MILGIVLAAGRSLRMGTPKAMLQLEGVTFLRRSATALADGGCDEVVVVVSASREGELVAGAARAAGARVVVNPAERSEQIDSLRTALRDLPTSTNAVVVTPVDAPGTEAAVVAALLRRFRETRPHAVVPVHDGERGHPVLFARAVFEDLTSGELDEGARSVLRMHQGRVAEVAVDRPDVLLDVDTPEDYRRLIESGDDRR